MLEMRYRIVIPTAEELTRSGRKELRRHPSVEHDRATRRRETSYAADLMEIDLL
jgi:hypothetical protein